MAERPTLVDPPIESLLHKVGDSKFTLVACRPFVRARSMSTTTASVQATGR